MERTVELGQHRECSRRCAGRHTRGIRSTCSMPASVSSTSRPYSSLSKWDARSERGDERGEPRRERCVTIDAAGNHEWNPRLVNHQRVRFVHQGEVERPMHQTACSHHQQIAKVVESGFLRRHVGDVITVGGAPSRRGDIPCWT